MKIGWIHDDPGYVGGAELTQAEFRTKAPAGVEVVDGTNAEIVVVHNCATFHIDLIQRLKGKRVIKYVNDCWPFGDGWVRNYLLKEAELIFTSPLHIARFPHEIKAKKVHEIPPAIDLQRFRSQTNGHREGNVCIGRMAYGKGTDLLMDYHEPIDVYSTVPVRSQGRVTYRGALDPEQVAKTLASYRTFVFLPTALEPFGRAVVEAWAAGLEIVVNGNVGARHWIEQQPQALETAAESFWAVVLHG